MAFSVSEKNRRYEQARRLMSEKKLSALVLIGDSAVGNHYYGNMRYFSDNKIICNRQVLLLFPEREPVVLATTLIQTRANERRSFLDDCRVSNDLPGDTINILREYGMTSGSIGLSYEMLPSAWYFILKEKLPGISFVDVQDDIMMMRNERSLEEVAALRRSAELCDTAYTAVMKFIKPGVTESEIVAEIEYATRRGGAEENFTLIGTGRFCFGAGNTLYLPYNPPAVSRKVETGDSIVMEITPRYDGYWTQLVRVVNVDVDNKDMASIQKVCVGAIREGCKALLPGSSISEAVALMDTFVRDNGFLMQPPLGHICGLDNIDARVSAANTTPLSPGQTIIMHPTLYTLDKQTNFFWGETYLITEDGCENMMRSSDDLITIK